MKEKKDMEEGFLFNTEELTEEAKEIQKEAKGMLEEAKGIEETRIHETNAPRHRGRKRSTETEDRPPLTQERMREILEDTKEIETPTGIKYVQLRLTKKMVIGIRESSGKEFTINLDELYRAYRECRRFSSPEVKRIIFMGHSPAVVLLRLLKAKALENESIQQNGK